MDDPKIRPLAAQPSVAVRVTRPMAGIDVGAIVDEQFGAVVGRIAALGAAIAGAPYVRYLEWGGETAVLELGFPVSAALGPDELEPLGGSADGQPGATALPGGNALVLEYRGPYTGLKAAWDLSRAWIDEHSLRPAGAPWESYVDNPDTVAPDAIRTEIVWPLEV